MATYAFLEKKELLQEDLSDWLSEFKTKAERMLKGFSAGEIDKFANEVNDIDTEVKKREVIAKIESAIKDAEKTKNSTTNADTRKECVMHLELLHQLLTKAKSVDIVGKPKEENKDSEENKRRVVNLDRE